jgi:hypothetical protein
MLALATEKLLRFVRCAGFLAWFFAKEAGITGALFLSLAFEHEMRHG